MPRLQLKEYYYRLPDPRDTGYHCSSIYCPEYFQELLADILGHMLLEYVAGYRCGHFFVIADISRFMPLERFYERIEVVINDIKSLPRIEGVNEIFMPVR